MLSTIHQTNQSPHPPNLATESIPFHTSTPKLRVCDECPRITSLSKFKKTVKNISNKLLILETFFANSETQIEKNVICKWLCKLVPLWYHYPTAAWVLLPCHRSRNTCEFFNWMGDVQRQTAQKISALKRCDDSWRLDIGGLVGIDSDDIFGYIWHVSRLPEYGVQ